MAARVRLIASVGSRSRETAKPRRDARAAAQSPRGAAARKIPPATSAPGTESRPGTTKPTPSAPPRLRANIPLSFSSSSFFPTSRLRAFARPPSRVPAEAGTQSQAEQRLMASGTLGSRLRGSTGLVPQGSRVRKSARRSERRHTIAGVPQLDPGLRANPLSLLISSRLRVFARSPSSVPAKAGTQGQAEQRLMASGTLGSRLRGSTGLVSQGSRVRRSTHKSERRHTIADVPQLGLGLRATPLSLLISSRLRTFAHPPSSVPAKAGTQGQAKHRPGPATLGSCFRRSTSRGSPMSSLRIDTAAGSAVPTPHHSSASSAPSRATPSPGASV